MAGLFDAETETLARAFAASSAAFLERLRWMTATLGRPYESFDAETRLISAGCVSVRKIRSPEDWRPQLEWNPPEIDMRAFSTHARQTREGWLIAREFNAELSKFDCATLERLTSWILKTHGGSEVTTLRVAVVDLFKIMEEFVQVVLEFHQAVERFELVLSMTAAAVPPPTKPAKRIRTKKRWTFPEIDTHIEQVLKSGDPEKIKAYVFEADEELASRIGCNKKTLYKTQFWQDERERMQAEWRRLNTAGEIPKKRDQ